MQNSLYGSCPAEWRKCSNTASASLYHPRLAPTSGNRLMNNFLLGCTLAVLLAGTTAFAQSDRNLAPNPFPKPIPPSTIVYFPQDLSPPPVAHPIYAPQGTPSLFYPSADPCSRLMQINQLQAKAFLDRQGLGDKYALARAEINLGLFCSQCKRPKSEIERTGEPFSAHLSRVKGRAVQNDPEAIKRINDEFRLKAQRLESEIKSLSEQERMYFSECGKYKMRRAQARQFGKGQMPSSQREPALDSGDNDAGQPIGQLLEEEAYRHGIHQADKLRRLREEKNTLEKFSDMLRKNSADRGMALLRDADRRQDVGLEQLQGSAAVGRILLPSGRHPTQDGIPDGLRGGILDDMAIPAVKAIDPIKGMGAQGLSKGMGTYDNANNAALGIPAVSGAFMGLHNLKEAERMQLEALGWTHSNDQNDAWRKNREQLDQVERAIRELEKELTQTGDFIESVRSRMKESGQ